MTELSFLIDLLLNHELKKETKDALAARIKDVEAGLVKTLPPLSSTNYTLSHPFSGPAGGIVPNTSGFVSPMPQQIAQTPQTQIALASHDAILAGQRPDMISTGAGTKGPRKW